MEIAIMKKNLEKFLMEAKPEDGLFTKEIMKQVRFHQSGMLGYIIGLISPYKETFMLGKNLTNLISQAHRKSAGLHKKKI